MSDAFDPYFKWLGIPKGDQPPHGYRLLGIELFESDADVISNAADGRMAQVKSFQMGKFAPVSQKLLNEIAAAKVCLLNPEKKAEYDRLLRARLQQKNAAASASTQGPEIEEPEVEEAGVAAEEGIAGLAFLDEAVAAKRKATRPTRKRKPRPWLIVTGVGAAAIAILVGVAIYLSMGGEGTPANPQTASAADRDRLAEAKKAGTAPDKPAGATDGPGPKPTGATSIVAAEGPHDPVPPPKTEPTPPAANPDTNPKPKLELADDPQHAASLEKDTEKSAEHAGENTVAAHPPATKKEPAKKPPIPDKEQFQAMKSKILKVFQKEFAEAKTPESKRALAERLDAQGDASRNDAVEQYSLWRIAADGAATSGNFAMAMEIVDKIQAQFELDGDGMKAEVLTTAAARTNIAPETARNLCEAALKLAADGAARGAFDVATQCARIAMAAARREKDPQFNREIMASSREIERLKTRHAAVAKAEATLASDADNTEANLVVGQWHCFAKGDWEKGLPYLAKGSRADLVKLANLELAKPALAKEQVALADAWWALAEKDRADSRSNYQARAVHWYEQALPNLFGLEKTRVEKQIASTKVQALLEIRGHGILQKGNVALASNGTTVVGPTVARDLMFGENIVPGRATEAPTPCAFTITFDKVYSLQQVRFLIYGNLSASYAVLVSRDGRKFDVLEDHRAEEMKGWQDLRFPPRPVKTLKLVCPKATNDLLEIAKFEAYCFLLPTADRGSRSARGPSR